jgi:hypothetical protein
MKRTILFFATTCVFACSYDLPTPDSNFEYTHPLDLDGSGGSTGYKFCGSFMKDAHNFSRSGSVIGWSLMGLGGLTAVAGTAMGPGPETGQRWYEDIYKSRNVEALAGAAVLIALGRAFIQSSNDSATAEGAAQKAFSQSNRDAYNACVQAKAQWRVSREAANAFSASLGSAGSDK